MKKEAILRNVFDISRLTHQKTVIDETKRALIEIYLQNILDIFDSLERQNE